MKLKEKLFLYPGLAILTLGFVVYYSMPKEQVNFLQASLLPALEMVNENLPQLQAPDLAIESVSLRKIADPRPDFNYYKYNATLVIHNYGGSLKDAPVVLSASANQKASYVKNTDVGFSLAYGKNYIIKDYELLFDADYNGAKVSFKIETKDKADSNEKNNVLEKEVVELSAKIANLKIDSIQSDGKFSLDFDQNNLSGYSMEIFVTDRNDHEIEEPQYREVYSNGNIYGYYLIENSPDFIEKAAWEKILPEKLLFNKKDIYLYIKATNPVTGFYLVSDILKLPKESTMTRADFAKQFVVQAKVKLNADGENLYEDIRAGDSFYPYVMTLFNLGLLDYSNEFMPAKTITRGEVLRIVLDHYDIDLKISDGAPHFEDVEESDEFYSYLESIYAKQMAQALWENPAMQEPATKDYLMYLINESRKAN